MSGRTKDTCDYPDCTSPQRSLGIRKKKPYYSRWCVKHQRATDHEGVELKKPEEQR